MQNAAGHGSGVLPGLAQAWRLSEGEHPGLPTATALMTTLSPLASPAQHNALLTAELPLSVAHAGHHIAVDNGYLGAAGQLDLWPLAPVYVRDLAGRILHTGLLPNPVPPQGPLTPPSCVALSPAAAGFDLLEKVFMVHLRRLELVPVPGTPLAGEGKRFNRALYQAPQRYPYKMRVDSFYQDGFRLPQLTRLHVENAGADSAGGAANEFIARWHKRPIGQSYDEFYESNGGQGWYDKLFTRGCTVIPTVEAYNGWYQVTADYGMADVWPGRAVSGLHEVVGEEPASSPPGSILKVVEPGYATRHSIQPAKVIVSTGSGYTAPAAPRPLLPDLRLPHPRTGGQWGSTWLPTHPAHFVQPALHDWTAGGDFVQTSGPLWDPVHYVYTSTPAILRALRRPLAAPPYDAPYLADVPEAMQPRFHPVCGLTGYDTPNQRTGLERKRSYAAASPLANSALDHVALGREIAGIGYHPLPAALEYEMDPAAAPQLGPGRFGTCPPDMLERLAPVIASTVTPDEARRLAVGNTDPVWQVVTHPRLYPASSGDAGKDYPQLQRFAAGEPPLPELARQLPLYLPELSATELFQNLKRIFSNKSYLAVLDSTGVPGLKALLQPHREASLAWRRLRYRMWRKHPAYYAQLWATLQPLAEPAGATPPEQNSAIHAAILGQFSIQTLPPGPSKVKSTPINPLAENQTNNK